MALDDLTQMKVRKVIAEHLHVSVADVLPGNLVGRDLGADSLHVVEIQMALEDELGLHIDDARLPADPTVQEYMDALAAPIDTFRAGKFTPA